MLLLGIYPQHEDMNIATASGSAGGGRRDRRPEKNFAGEVKLRKNKKNQDQLQQSTKLEAPPKFDGIRLGGAKNFLSNEEFDVEENGSNDDLAEREQPLGIHMVMPKLSQPSISIRSVASSNIEHPCAAPRGWYRVWASVTPDYVFHKFPKPPTVHPKNSIQLEKEISELKNGISKLQSENFYGKDGNTEVVHHALRLLREISQRCSVLLHQHSQLSDPLSLPLELRIQFYTIESLFSKLKSHPSGLNPSDLQSQSSEHLESTLSEPRISTPGQGCKECERELWLSNLEAYQVKCLMNQLLELENRSSGYIKSRVSKLKKQLLERCGSRSRWDCPKCGRPRPLRPQLSDLESQLSEREHQLSERQSLLLDWPTIQHEWFKSDRNPLIIVNPVCYACYMNEQAGLCSPLPTTRDQKIECLRRKLNMQLRPSSDTDEGEAYLWLVTYQYKSHWSHSMLQTLEDIRLAALGTNMEIPCSYDDRSPILSIFPVNLKFGPKEEEHDSNLGHSSILKKIPEAYTSSSGLLKFEEARRLDRFPAWIADTRRHDHDRHWEDISEDISLLQGPAGRKK